MPSVQYEDQWVKGILNLDCSPPYPLFPVSWAQMWQGSSSASCLGISGLKCSAVFVERGRRISGGRQKKADTVLGKLHRLLNISLSACFSPITQDPSLPLTSPLPWIFLCDCHKNGAMSTCMNWIKSVVLRLVLTMENSKYQCYIHYKSV